MDEGIIVPEGEFVEGVEATPALEENTGEALQVNVAEDIASGDGLA